MLDDDSGSEEFSDINDEDLGISRDGSDAAMSICNDGSDAAVNISSDSGGQHSDGRQENGDLLA